MKKQLRFSIVALFIIMSMTYYACKKEKDASIGVENSLAFKIKC